jgi:GAF domain-containing protein/HAMP domain-containing protein
MNLLARLSSLPLRTKLLLGLVVSAVGAMILVGFAISSYNEAAQPVAAVLTRTVAIERANALNAVVNSLMISVSRLANDRALQDAYGLLAANPDDPAARQAALNGFQAAMEQNANFRQISFLSADGEALLTALPQPADAVRTFDVRSLLARPALSGVYIGSIQSRPEASLDVLTTVIRGTERLGYVAINLDPSRGATLSVPGIYDALRPFASSAGPINLYLVGGDGSIESPFAAPVIETAETVAAARALGTRAGQAPGEYLSPLVNRNVLGFVTFVGSLGRRLVAEVRPIQLGTAPIEAGPFVLSISALLLGVFAALSLVWLFFETTIILPMRRLSDIAARAAQGRSVEELPPPVQDDEIGSLARSFNQITELTRQDIRALESRIAQRTRDIEATRDIAQILSSIRDLDALLRQVIELIRERFPDIYHAQVFLLDPTRQYAVLRVSTGEAGAKLLARGHRLAVGSQSVIGRTTADGEPVVALDTSTSPIHRVNELLPDTRAELALPLRTREGIIGALDLQSKRPEAFSDADVRLFQSMADELAIAINNARLFEESQARLREIEELNRRLLGEAWRGYAAARRKTRMQTGQPAEEGEAWSALQQQAVETGRLAEHVEDDVAHFAVPVMLRDQVFGAVEWTMPRRSYNENTRLLARELADRLAVSADNARLLEHTQRLASRERLVSDIAGKLLQQTDVAQVLQVAVRELGLALQVPQTAIRLSVAPQAAGWNGSDASGSGPLEPEDARAEEAR